VQSTPAGLVLSPTDLTKHLACAHLTALDLAVAEGRLAKPAQSEDEALELLFRKGLEHEQAYLARLRAAGHRITGIDTDSLEVAEAAIATEVAMRAGVEVIYQATFLHGHSRGHADFLLRRNRPSDLGAWSYDLADTKLARRLKVPALLQMAVYADHLARLQGTPPEQLLVVTRDGEERPVALADVEAYARRVRARLDAFLAASSSTRPEPSAHCGQCRWVARCAAQWRREDHLSLVAFLRGDHREALTDAGIVTVAALAASTPADLPRAIGAPSRERLVAQAALQVTERETGEPTYELLPPEDGRGLLRLPEPSLGDVYLDFEGDPYAGDGGREYLAGLWDRSGAFTTFWAHSDDEERALTEQLVDSLLDRWGADPGMHVYHYAPYERSALQRLTARHGVREAELDQLLRGDRLVDLYAVVRQGMRISKESYSIKKLEAFYWGGVRGSGEDVADAMSSVVAYERWLVDRDDTVLDQIAAYNRDDVRSTHDLHAWLEEQRAELESLHGPQSRRGLGEERREPGEEERAEAALAAELEAAGHPLLAGLVGWHRREARPRWWDFFRTGDLTGEELVEDGTTLGGLSAPELVEEVKRSRVWRYTFPPQDTKVKPGTVHDVRAPHPSVGTVVEIAPTEGRLTLKLDRKKDAPLVDGLQPPGPINDGVLRQAVQAVARDVLAGGRPLGQVLLSREVPAALPVRAGESAADAVVRVGTSLAGEVLAVQGPPGSGKTTAGAALIRALLDQGKRVGVTALSHAVIGNLLAAVGRPALQKCDEDDHSGADQVERAASNDDVVAALASGKHRLVGGSAWLWAREDLAHAVDVLVVDEAGQFSLASAVAVSRAARSLVLLGDPQQLAQPTQADHPHGSGVSALEHPLGAAATLAADRGVFLDRTYRMHPAVTSFVSTAFYAGLLQSAPGRDGQALLGAGAWSGAGLRWVPVEHRGNESASSEEAAAVAAVVAELLGGSWRDCHGVVRPVTLDDVLVVAPYNAHVARLREVLPSGARVGTVDKFQGQEAPVVVYSLASSSADDAPRGVGFLYDTHRLNVAVSRAQCVSVVVGAPALLDAEVGTVEQLRRVNALCRYVDEAVEVVVPARAATAVAVPAPRAEPDPAATRG
jgi:predicted RecB family nuclease